MRSSLLSFILLLWTWAAPQATPADAELNQTFQAGVRAHQAGQWEQAVAAYARVIADDRSPQVRFKASLESALALQAWAADAPDQSEDLLPRAMESYRATLREGLHALPESSRADMLVAANNLATLYIESNQFTNALDVLAKVDYSSHPDAFVFEFNRARALEGAGRKEQAFETYLKTLAWRPPFQQASARALELALNAETNASAWTLRLIDQTLSTGRSDLAGSQIVAAARKFHNPLLLPRAITYCAEAGFTPAEYLEPDKRPATLRDAWAVDQLNPLFSSLREIYDSNGLLELAPARFYEAHEDHDRRLRNVRSHLGSLGELMSSNPQRPDKLREALSKLTQRVADMYSQQWRKSDRDARLAQAAAVRYSMAWVLDLRNVEAAVQFVTILRHRGRESAEERKTYDDFISTLFSIKGGLYAQANNLSADAWSDLYYLHWMLGDIFIDDPGHRRYNSEDPRSPIFQYERALMTGDRLRSQFNLDPAGSEELRRALERARNF